MKYDYLVIGGGIAGLSFALKVADNSKVLVLFKNDPFESATSWAQGGIAAVETSDDNINIHIDDTLTAGGNVNDENVVKYVIENARQRVQELIDYGVKFDQEENSYHLHKEGGHTRNRIFHVADSTGHEIQKTLLDQVKSNPNIEIIYNSSAIDLITSKKINPNSKNNRILGVYVLIENKVEKIIANKVLIATGGLGKVYLYTSNPDSATGDGVAMCYRAGLPIKDLEFIQFHPTCLYHADAKTFLITEAMRGEGAILKRVDGTEFMHKYHPLKELAPRDIVARAIDNEIKKHGDDYVYLDIRYKGKEFILKHFPMIYAKCLSFGIDITKDPIPVVPAAHYSCGGVQTGMSGETSITGLYVTGESACTGLHGANRLASNSLIEALVFSHSASIHARNLKINDDVFDIPDWNNFNAKNSDEEVVITHTWDEIRRLMWNYVGIVKTDKRLERALRRIELIESEIHQYYWDFILTKNLIELRNICLIAKLIIQSAQARKQNIGLHFNLDLV